MVRIVVVLNSFIRLATRYRERATVCEKEKGASIQQLSKSKRVNPVGNT